MHILSPEISLFLNQQKGVNDRRNYFMINLQERILPTGWGSNPNPVRRKSNCAIEASRRSRGQMWVFWFITLSPSTSLHKYQPNLLFKHLLSQANTISNFYLGNWGPDRSRFYHNPPSSGKRQNVCVWAIKISPPTFLPNLLHTSPFLSFFYPNPTGPGEQSTGYESIAFVIWNHWFSNL